MEKYGKLIDDLHSIGAVKFGEFKLKSGMISPIYVDLRILVSYPEVMKEVAEAINDVVKDLKFDKIAGVPYAALPIAAALSVMFGHKMIYTRKEVKDYGTKKAIEGVYKSGERVLVVDDLITTGASKLEVIAPLEAEGLVVKDIAVLVDREQGGKEQLAAKGYTLHSALPINDMLDHLHSKGKISDDDYNKSKDFVQKSRV